MALSYKALFFTILSTDSGTKSLTGFGFQPKIVRVTANGRSETADTAGLANIRLSIGAGASTSDRGVVAFFSQDGAANATVGSRMAAGLIMETDAAGAEIGFADFGAFVSDGVEINITNTFSANIRVLVEAWGGSDITNVKAALKFDWGAATGNATITGAGFDPGTNSYFSFFGGGHATGTLPTVEEDTWQPMIGVARSASPVQDGVLLLNHDDDSANSDTDSYIRGDECLASMDPAGAAVTNRRASFVGAATDGFTIDVLQATAAARHAFVTIIKGGSYHVGDLLTQTDTTTDIVESSFGFAPTGASFFSIGQAQSTAGAPGTDGRISAGNASSITDEKCLATASNNGAGNMQESTAIEHDEVYIRITDTTGAVEGLMRMQSFDSGGFTCRMDDADVSALFVFYSAYGNAAAAPSRRVMVVN